MISGFIGEIQGQGNKLEGHCLQVRYNGGQISSGGGLRVTLTTIAIVSFSLPDTDSLYYYLTAY